MLPPANFVADSHIEQQFTQLEGHDVKRPSGTQNRERRWYYFGSEIPSTPHGGGGTLPITPRRPGSGGWSPGAS